MGFVPPGERGSDGRWFFETCYKCKEPFAISMETYRVLQRSHRDFHCPWGHAQHYVEGETEAQRLRRERDQLIQRVAQRDDAIQEMRQAHDHEKKRAAAFKGQVTRLRNRAKAGVCPCCSRHFENLERHMANKHPDFSGDPPDNVVEFKSA